jgi:hypothetical protein
MDGTITTEDPIKSPDDFQKICKLLIKNYNIDELVITNLNLLYGE